MSDEYAYFMRPEPRQDMGPITVDPETGRRTRTMKIGMVRNAKDQDKKEVTVVLDPIPHIVIDHGKPLQGWYKAKHSPPGVRARPCYSEALLTEPYGGYCTTGCAFCYVNSGFRGYRGSGLVTVPRNYGAFVRKQLKSFNVAAAGYFSSFTDPFIALEDVYHNTQEGAQAFVDAGLPVFFLSRLRYPGWAFDLLRKNKYSYAQKSINTPDQEDWQKLSPGALSLNDHLEEIRELRRQGIYVSIQVNPIIAGIVTHEDVETLFDMLADAGANHVIVKFVEAGYSWAPAMVERMKQRFGDNRASSFAQLFTENIGGQKGIQEEYRLEGHRRYQKKATEVGLTYATCYEYAFGRGPDGSINDRVGQSLGPRFMTSDQCHGQRVPMFERHGDIFREIAECPPSGCLTCADGGSPRCGSDLLGQAKELRTADFKRGR